MNMERKEEGEREWGKKKGEAGKGKINDYGKRKREENMEREMGRGKKEERA